MNTLACRDPGINCNYVAKGNTVAEVKKAAMEHAGKVRADVLKSMSSPEQMAKMDQLMEKMVK